MIMRLLNRIISFFVDLFFKRKYKKQYKIVKELQFGDMFWHHIEQYEQYTFEGRHQNRPFTFLKYENGYIYALFMSSSKYNSNDFMYHEGYIHRTIFKLHIKDILSTKQPATSYDELMIIARIAYDLDPSLNIAGIKDFLSPRAGDIVEFNYQLFYLYKVVNNEAVLLYIQPNPEADTIMLDGKKHININFETIQKITDLKYEFASGNRVQEDVKSAMKKYLIIVKQSNDKKSIQLTQRPPIIEVGDIVEYQTEKYILYSKDSVLSTIYPLVNNYKEYFVKISNSAYVDIFNPKSVKNNEITLLKKGDESKCTAIKDSKRKYRLKHKDTSKKNKNVTIENETNNVVNSFFCKKYEPTSMRIHKLLKEYDAKENKKIEIY